MMSILIYYFNNSHPQNNSLFIHLLCMHLICHINHHVLELVPTTKKASWSRSRHAEMVVETFLMLIFQRRSQPISLRQRRSLARTSSPSPAKEPQDRPLHLKNSPSDDKDALLHRPRRRGSLLHEPSYRTQNIRGVQSRPSHPPKAPHPYRRARLNDGPKVSRRAACDIRDQERGVA